jgi:SAM-dependent methyltransferase
VSTLAKETDTRAFAADVELVCPQCAAALNLGGSAFECARCGVVARSIDGIPCFADPEYYWGEVPRETMRLANELACRQGWEAAIVQTIPDGALRKYVSDPRRADFQNVWGLPSTSVVLDVGAGWGAIACGLAQNFAHVVAAEGVLERARFIRKRASQSGLDHIQVVCADFLKLPFSRATFDAIVLNGVVEWVGLANREGDPRDLQLQFLRRIHELLKPGGVACVGIENRIGLSMFRGSRDHSGLAYTSLMPRAMARAWCRWKAGRHRSDVNTGYRTYTYSLGGYRRLFAEAGFSRCEPFHPVNGYNDPGVLLPLKNQNALLHYVNLLPTRTGGPRGALRCCLQMAAIRTGLWAQMASDYVFVLRKAEC